jgi:D-alanyl-D-alanine dipeptidase
VLVLVAGGLAIAVGQLGMAAVRAGRAQTAADAGALAAAVADRAAAATAVVANGGRLVDLVRDGAEVEVVVVVGNAVASARARRQTPVAAPTGQQAGLAPAMLAAVARAEQLLGQELPITSGRRSEAEQRRLWEARHTNPYPVAAPGTSMHEHGLAVDIPRWFVATLLAVADDAGLCRPLPGADPVHFELCPNP